MKEKRLDYEILRLTAILLVVFNHSQHRGFELYLTAPAGSVNYYGSLLLGVLCKMAVPLFFLVSGGLLLDREEPIRVTLRKRVLRIAVALVLFSGILYLFWIAWGYAAEPGLGDFLRRLWGAGVSTPYWYLYTYLGLMLMLPLLGPMVRHMSDRAFLYLSALHLLIFGLCRTLGQLTVLGPLDPDLAVPLAEPDLFYFILGYYLAHRFPWEKFTGKRLAGLWVCAAGAILLMLLTADHLARTTGASGIDYHNGWMLLPVLAVYASVHRAVERRPLRGWGARLVSELGGCVFGAYLLEGILRHHLDVVYQALETRIHVLPACIVWVILVVLSGLGITWLLKKLPLLNKIL